MFETAELGNKIDKAAFKAAAEKLRVELLDAQRKLAQSDFSVVIAVAGAEGAGKAEIVNLLLEWMDPRGIEVHAMGEPSDEERERPRFWRYWRALPPKGKIGVFLGSWYTDPILRRVFKQSDAAALDLELNRIVAFEKMLSQENTLLLKFWMHLSKEVQKKNLSRIEKDPDNSWRVTKMDWKFFHKYNRFRKVSEHAILLTGTGQCPWRIIDAQDKRYRSLEALRLALKAIRARLDVSKKAREADPAAVLPKSRKINILSKLDLSLTLSPKKYKKDLAEYQGALNRLARKMYDKKRSMILLFEGPDAGGKGGAIRRLTQAMDARNYRVATVAAPTDEERSHPYLWRFWRGLPRLGKATIYDRSWYGRVLVERLEGFCRPEDWQRAYEEINQFEAQLAEFGVIIVKFWLAISQEEQLRRFKDRQLTAYKQYKITQEDWRNREKWDAYQAAACDMIEKTNNAAAPWVLVEGNDKRWARIKILEATCRQLEKGL
ncbi:MAG: polyphosphate:AMP phosphotransferase [Elusimicrobia bacterium]|nr:polyphosphate:AMP phosphotransferase [Elusimicrobiota bacterium]